MIRRCTFSELKNVWFVKTIHWSRVHNGYQLKEGLNDIAPEQFSCEQPCSPGGIYFVEHLDYDQWLFYNGRLNALIADVQLLEDSQICVENPECGAPKYKADKVVLSNFRRVQKAACINYSREAKLLFSSYYEECLSIVAEDPYLLLSFPPEEISQCMWKAAVSRMISLDIIGDARVHYFALLKSQASTLCWKDNAVWVRHLLALLPESPLKHLDSRYFWPEAVELMKAKWPCE